MLNPGIIFGNSISSSLNGSSSIKEPFSTLVTFHSTLLWNHTWLHATLKFQPVFHSVTNILSSLNTGILCCSHVVHVCASRVHCFFYHHSSLWLHILTELIFIPEITLHTITYPELSLMPCLIFVPSRLAQMVKNQSAVQETWVQSLG